VERGIGVADFELQALKRKMKEERGRRRRAVLIFLMSIL